MTTPKLQTIYGRASNNTWIKSAYRTIQGLDPSGTLYVGFPVLPTADEPLVVEMLLTCKEYGVVVFDFTRLSSLAEIQQRQDGIYIELEKRLSVLLPQSPTFGQFRTVNAAQ